MRVRATARVAFLAGVACALAAGAAAAPPGQVQSVASAAAPGVRFTVPARTSRESWFVAASSLVGDVNGDRVPDLAFAVEHLVSSGSTDVGDPDRFRSSRFVRVVFGGRLPPVVKLTANGVRGFRIAGLPGDAGLGSSLAGVGDVNGDGRGDLALGAPGDDDSPGAAYVVFGKGSTAPVDVAHLGDGGAVLSGAEQWGQAGLQVAGGHDVNGDGRPDVLVGALWRSPEWIEKRERWSGFAPFFAPPGSERSVVYAVFGGRLAGTVDLDSLGDGGFEVGASPTRLSTDGGWLASLGDVNGDGLGDIGVGSESGASIVRGRRAAGPANGGIVDVRIPGERGRPHAVAATGDVNGDGLADVLIGSENGRPDVELPVGYVVFGRRSPAAIDASKLGRGGIVLRAAAPAAGRSIFGLGDMNGDDRPDVGVLARTSYGGTEGRGSLYVVFGGTSAGDLSLSHLGVHGARLDGATGSPVGDVGGVADLLPTPGREVLIATGTGMKLVPFAPQAAEPAPHLVASIALGRPYPSGIVGAYGSLWVATSTFDTPPTGYLLRIDPRTNRLAGRPLALGLPATAIAAANGSLWITVVPRHQGNPARLLRVDPATGRVVSSRPLGRDRTAYVHSGGPDSIQAGFGSLWITYRNSRRIYRVDPANGRTLAAIQVGSDPKALTFAAGKVWVVDRSDGAVRTIDPARNRVVGTALPVTGYDKTNRDGLGDTLWLGTDADRVWVYDSSRPGLVVVNPVLRTFSARPPAPAAGRAFGIAQGTGTLWIVDSSGVGRIGLDDGRPVGSHLELRTDPRTGATFYDGSLWTIGSYDHTLVRIDAPR